MSMKGTLPVAVLFLSIAATGCGNVANNTANTAQNAARTVGNTTRGTVIHVANDTRAPQAPTTNKGKPKAPTTTKPAPKPNINAAQWMTVDMAHKTITLKLVAGYQGKNGGLNYNGFSHGNMSITVPQNWRVKVNFQNADSRPHSAVIVPYSQRQTAPTKPAFSGASTSGASSGVAGGQSQSFTFKATKKGQYAIVSAVKGDSSAGMWDSLFVYPNIGPAIGAK